MSGAAVALAAPAFDPFSPEYLADPYVGARNRSGIHLQTEPIPARIS